MKDISLKGNIMDLVYKVKLMEVNMKDNLKMMIMKGMELKPFQMGKDMKVNFLKAICMEKELFSF